MTEETAEAIKARIEERLAEILRPYGADREGPNGFPALAEREANEILAMPLSRRELAVSVAAYRRKAVDQEEITALLYEAWTASERLNEEEAAALRERAGTSAASAAAQIGNAGRPPRESDRARAAIAALYPAGVPPESAVSHSELHRQVNGHILRQKLPAVSRDTVRRARSDCAK